MVVTYQTQTFSISRCIANTTEMICAIDVLSLNLSGEYFHVTCFPSLIPSEHTSGQSTGHQASFRWSMLYSCGTTDRPSAATFYVVEYRVASPAMFVEFVVEVSLRSLATIFLLLRPFGRANSRHNPLLTLKWRCGITSRGADWSEWFLAHFPGAHVLLDYFSIYFFLSISSVLQKVMLWYFIICENTMNPEFFEQIV